MSQASASWSEVILVIRHNWLNKVVTGAGSVKDPPPHKWTVQTTEGETWNEGKYRGTPGALAWLKKSFMVLTAPHELKVVTGANLPKVKGNCRSAKGKTNVSIGNANDIHNGSTFDFAMGLVELKTNKYPLKVGQNLLVEPLSLSTTSTFKEAVILLATDCTTNWEFFFFWMLALHYPESVTKAARPGMTSCNHSILSEIGTTSTRTVHGFLHYLNLPSRIWQDLKCQTEKEESQS